MRTTEADDSEGRLVILGGGISSLTAAFYASEAGHERVFPGGIHVYEMTGMLGGKGASLRRNSKKVLNRIEEHGLHVWFGFYDNAFHLLAECHEYLEREAAKGYKRKGSSLRSVEDGFRPCCRVAAMDYDGSFWLPWVADFPEDSTTRPWDKRADGEAVSSPVVLVVRALKLVETFLHSVMGRSAAVDGAPATLLDPSLIPIPIQLPATTPFTDALDRFLTSSDESAVAVEGLSRVLGVVARLATEARNRLDEPIRQHCGLRRIWYLVDLVLAAVRGLVDDGVVSTGRFDLIDDVELRAWLVFHGASEESASSGLLKALVYDLAFAYEDGNPEKPSCSAATGVHGLFRLLLTYRGAIMYKMNAGMGEVVFAPIYEALERRGVKFHFGQEVERIELDERGGRTRATRITFKRNDDAARVRFHFLKIKDGPLAGKLPGWFATDPDGEKKPERAAEPIQLGAHDMVVYGLPVGTIPRLLPHAPKPWQICAEKVKTVGTAALQLWLSEPVERYAPWATPDMTVGAYTEPFDTWSDMKLLAGEDRARTDASMSVAYFTNVAPTGMSEEVVAREVKEFVHGGLKILWPGYEPNMILDDFARLNADESSRYTLSLPGTLRARLSPRDDSISNVRPVGDWTRNSISAGCIEAAVISGMIAAQVLRPDRHLVIFGERAR